MKKNWPYIIAVGIADAGLLLAFDWRSVLCAAILTAVCVFDHREHRHG